MMTKLELPRLIKSCVIFLLICGTEIFFMASIISADTDDTVRWPVQATSNWNSIYGEVSDLPLGNGDSVGMFDGKGNCYGAGLVRGGYYYLSAYSREEANPAIPGDFTIPGFREGDEVIFKAFKKDTNEEFLVMPADGIAHTYFYEGKYPPVRIDLVLADSSSYSSSEDNESTWYGGGTGSSLGGTLYSDSDQDDLEEPAEEDEIVLEEPDKEDVLAAKPEVSRKGERERKFDKDLYDRHKSIDYYERESPSAETESPMMVEPPEYSVDRSSKDIARETRAMSSEHISKEKKSVKETIAEDATLGEETCSIETARALNRPVQKRLPVIPIVIFICVAGIGTATIQKLRRGKK